MVVSLRMRSNATREDYSQDALRGMLAKSPATHRFLDLFGTPLAAFVGEINEIYEAPKAEGVAFQFAHGMRTPFLNLVDPSTVAGPSGRFDFDAGKKGKLIPDDPGAGHRDRAWRKLASAMSAGISFREPGLNPSLHIAISAVTADVHLDREGFVTTIDKRVTYDPKQTLNHITADLASDFVPGLVSSLTVKDDSGKTSFQATFAPWLEVNLSGTRGPMGKRSSTTEAIAGLRLFGIFELGGG